MTDSQPGKPSIFWDAYHNNYDTTHSCEEDNIHGDESVREWMCVAHIVMLP